MNLLFVSEIWNREALCLMLFKHSSGVDENLLFCDQL